MPIQDEHLKSNMIKSIKYINTREILAEIEPTARLATNLEQFLKSKESIPIILQKGPVCGLIAIAMSVLCLVQEGSQKSNWDRELTALLELAQSKGYSVKGEIFDVENLHQLARFHLQSKGLDHLISTTVITISEWQFDPDAESSKSVYLIAYDKGPDNRPVLKNGMSSHWALVLGFFYQNDELKAVLLHGLSRLPLITGWKEIVDSNANLNLRRDNAKLENKLSNRMVKLSIA